VTFRIGHDKISFTFSVQISWCCYLNLAGSWLIAKCILSPVLCSLLSFWYVACNHVCRDYDDDRSRDRDRDRDRERDRDRDRDREKDREKDRERDRNDFNKASAVLNSVPVPTTTAAVTSNANAVTAMQKTLLTQNPFTGQHVNISHFTINLFWSKHSWPMCIKLMCIICVFMIVKHIYIIYMVFHNYGSP